MPAKVQWTGLTEFQAALRNLPDALAKEAANEGRSAANAAAVDIRTAYGAHRHTGRLQDSVKVTEQKVAFGFRYTVRTSAKHAHLLEFGTQARHTTLGISRGSTPPFNIFIPRTRRWQRSLMERLIALLQRQGLRVTGDAR